VDGALPPRRAHEALCRLQRRRAHRQDLREARDRDPATTVVEIVDSGEVTLMDNSFRKSALQVDNVVLASVEPEESLYGQLIERELSPSRSVT